MDIVKRLTKYAIHSSPARIFGIFVEGSDMMLEAANEIERLRLELDIERQTNAVLVAEVDKLRALTTWHRIDDPDSPPPKDGTWIMLYAPMFNGGKLTELDLTHWIAQWDEFNAGWYDQDDVLTLKEGDPTHWRPLPPSPEEK